MFSLMEEDLGGMFGRPYGAVFGHDTVTVDPVDAGLLQAVAERGGGRATAAPPPASPRTYGELKRQFGTDDFSPRTQDLMALQKLKERQVLDQVLKGDVLGTLEHASKEWAALPKGPGQGSYYLGQPAISSDELLRLFDLYRSP